MRTTVDEDESMQSQRALSSIFGMESDDDEDENSELTMSRIPETQDNLVILILHYGGCLKGNLNYVF